MGQNALSDFVPLFSIGGKGLCSRGTDYSQSKGKYVCLFQVTVVLWVRTAKLVHDISQKIVTCQEFLRKRKKKSVYLLKNFICQVSAVTFFDLWIGNSCNMT